MPTMMQAMFPMEVLETPGQVTFIQEAYNQVRRVHLDEELVAPEDAEPRFAGHSAGRWEGDTLVVETVTDPEYLTGPWTWRWMYKRWPGYKFQEYVCEDNRYYQDPALGYQRLRLEQAE